MREPGASEVLMCGCTRSPACTAFFASRPAASSTLGLEVLVQLVMAAIEHIAVAYVQGVVGAGGHFAHGQRRWARLRRGQGGAVAPPFLPQRAVRRAGAMVPLPPGHPRRSPRGGAGSGVRAGWLKAILGRRAG